MFAALKACPLRVDFALRQPNVSTQRSVHAVLGDIAHAVLDSAVREAAWNGEWKARLDQLWISAVEAAVNELNASGDRLGGVDPGRWPDYELKRARLIRVFADISELIGRAGPDAQILTEQILVGAGGRIRGRADLIIQSSLLHVVLDYKTGRVASAGGAVNEDYLVQMQLYGYLEKERSGEWPSEAYLVPFGEPALRLSIQPGLASEMVRSALAELDAFNERAAIGTQPAHPGPLTCRNCDFATRCGSFWEACNAGWIESVVAARGSVVRVARGQLPVVNVEVSVHAGSIPNSPVLIRQIPFDEFPAAEFAEPGRVAALVGLVEEGSRASYRLRPWGRFWMEPR